MGLDLNFKTWKWSQWLALVGLLQAIFFMFFKPYVYVRVLNLRITLLIFAVLLLMLYNFLYVLGFFVNYEKKLYLILMAVPAGLIFVDMLFFYFVKRAVPYVIVHYSAFLIFLLSYLFYSLTLYVNYSLVEVTYEDLSDRELYELGVIDENPDMVSGGVAVKDRSKSVSMTEL